MTILQLQRRIMEAGRIRIGQQVPTNNGKTRPAKLDTFRITSADRSRIDAIARLYGGTPREWDAPAGKQWEVVTETDALPVIVPPTDMAFSQHYELWAAGGCQRRCDGQTEQIADKPCVCDPEARDCDIHTRLSVMLRDVPGLGVYRLDTQGYYAAVELQGAIEIVQMAAARGAMIPARLRLEQRVTKRPGVGTRRFAVPVIDLEVSPAQLLGGQNTIAIGPPPGETGGLAALPAAQPQEDGPPALLTPVPPTVVERPVAPVADQAAAAGQPKGARRAGASAAIPRTGLAPRTAAQVAAGEQPDRGEPEGAAPIDGEDLEALSVEDLRDRIRAEKAKGANLKLGGNKDELIARLTAHYAETSGSSTSSEVEEPPPPPDDEPGSRPFDRAAAQQAFHARLHDLGLDYERQVKPWMHHQFGKSLSALSDGGLSNLLDAMTDRGAAFVATVKAHPGPASTSGPAEDPETGELLDQPDPGPSDGPAPEPPDEEPELTPAERAHARANGDGELGTLQDRIRGAQRVLAVHDQDVYQGGWERLDRIVDGRASGSDWTGASVTQLRQLADDMEREAATHG